MSLAGKRPGLAGMFLWKWFPELPRHEEEDFRLQTPAIKALIAKHWKPDSPVERSGELHLASEFLLQLRLEIWIIVGRPCGQQ